MSIRPEDIMFYGGGAALQRYGTISRRTASIGRRGEDVIETFTRTGAGGYFVARDGTIQAAAANVPRVNWIDADGDDIRDTAALLLEDEAENLVLQSDDLRAAATPQGWTETNVTVTAQTATCGVIELSSLVDARVDVMGYVESLADFGFTGDGKKCCSLVIGVDTTDIPTETTLQMYDHTAAASMGGIAITWDADGVPTLTAGAPGEVLGDAVLLSDGLYLVYFQTDAVTAANNNRLYIWPASSGAEDTGTIYVGGVTATDLTDVQVFPIRTTGTAVTRNDDGLIFPYWARPRAQSMYAKFIERGPGVSYGCIWHIGSSSGGGEPRVQCLKSPAGTVYQVQHVTGAGLVTSALAAVPTAGQTVELLALLNSNGSVQLYQSLDGAAATAAGLSGALALESSWAGTNLYIGSRALVNISFTENIAFINARGASHDMDDFRAWLP